MYNRWLSHARYPHGSGKDPHQHCGCNGGGGENKSENKFAKDFEKDGDAIYDRIESELKRFDRKNTKYTDMDARYKTERTKIDEKYTVLAKSQAFKNKKRFIEFMQQQAKVNRSYENDQIVEYLDDIIGPWRFKFAVGFFHASKMNKMRKSKIEELTDDYHNEVSREMLKDLGYEGNDQEVKSFVEEELYDYGKPLSFNPFSSYNRQQKRAVNENLQNDRDWMPKSKKRSKY